MDQKRPDDAEKELRALAAANPSDVEASLNVVRFLQQLKGPAAAREELLARIKAGADVAKYQIALAEFDFAQGAPTTVFTCWRSSLATRPRAMTQWRRSSHWRKSSLVARISTRSRSSLLASCARMIATMMG